MYTVNQLHAKAMSPRKKKRKYSSDNSVATYGHTKATSIVDRVIDLSKYNSETGLYTLTRDWMNVAPSSATSRQQTSETVSTEGFITALPNPVPADCITIEQLNDEIGKEIRSGQANDMELINSLNLDETTEIHALRKLHVARWKSCRRKWVDYYDQTNRAYKNSNDLLKSIYEEMQ